MAGEDPGAAGRLAAAGGGVGSGDDGERGVGWAAALRNLPVLYANAIDTQIHVGGLFAGRTTRTAGAGKTTHGAQPHFGTRRLTRKRDDDGMETGGDGKADLVGRRQRPFTGGAGEIDFEIVLAIEREVVAKGLAARRAQGQIVRTGGLLLTANGGAVRGLFSLHFQVADGLAAD